MKKAFCKVDYFAGLLDKVHFWRKETERALYIGNLKIGGLVDQGASAVTKEPQHKPCQRYFPSISYISETIYNHCDLLWHFKEILCPV